MSDGYVGIVKGVALGINPELKLIDITHEIPSWNIAAAAWVIWNAHRFFPEATVHLCVVDPAVGSKSQRGIALTNGSAFFVGPDNGIFSLIADWGNGGRCHELANDQYWRPDVSSTFHTRDIYGPVCAHLAKGVPIESFGPAVRVETLKRIALPRFAEVGGGAEGSIVYIDKFGNLITNIPASAVHPGQRCFLGKVYIASITSTYSSAEPGKPAAFIGSHGYLEIGVYQGRAEKSCGASVGDSLRLEPLE
jgi:hypothetical protein